MRRRHSNNYRNSSNSQRSGCVMYGNLVGAIEVYYLTEKPLSYEGPFLAEERRLLNALAEQLGRIAERIKAEKELRRERDFAESLIQFALMAQIVTSDHALLARTQFHIDGTPVDWTLLLVPDVASMSSLRELLQV